VPEEDEELKDATGTLLNVIAGQFKIDIVEIGYTVEMSHFSNYRNSALRGVDFNPKQTDKYEISFDVDNQKRLVFELSMGEYPRKK
jgi:hypothetical protein